MIPNPIITIQPSQFEEFNAIVLSNGVTKILGYPFQVDEICAKKGKPIKRKFIVEVHYYQGFAMIKYYPRHLKNHDHTRYQLRDKQLGYQIKAANVRRLLFYCATIMREYLETHSSNFIGYIGQPDSKDDAQGKKRLKAQRSSIYDDYIINYFRFPKYSIPANDVLGDMNTLLIRRVLDKKKEYTLTSQQLKNYDSFMKVLQLHKSEVPKFMTGAMRRLRYPDLNKGTDNRPVPAL